MTKLLSVNADAKTVKGKKKGYMTGILYLSPATESGLPHVNLCTNSSPGCRAACLYTAGRAGYFPRINESRRRKTEWLVRDRVSFCIQLSKDILATIKKAKREGYTPVFRLNGTSDLPWLAHYMAKLYPNVQFYDYTKHPNAWERVLPNYHLTFSLSEENKTEAFAALSHGINVAVVFDTKRGQPLPKTWEGYPVVDGDDTDLRFRDGKTTRNPLTNNAGLTKLRGVIIGLRAKGRAKKDCTGFVQRQQSLVQIGGLNASRA